MTNTEAEPLAHTAVRLGLLDTQQVQEGWEELGTRKVAAGDFLQCMERKGYLTPFQSGKLLKGETDGFFVGGYRILYKIASGSFGRVYRADDPSIGRVVAIKVLRKKWSADQHKIDLFMREGKMGMSLRHPNIVEIIAVNHDKKLNQYYIVMEFVEGGNLRDFLNIRKKLPPSDVLAIIEDTASALSHAFSKGITHRDMKLTNILLSSAGPAKLVDFGLAGAQQMHAAPEADGDLTVDRTVDYAGLEKSTDAPHGDPRSDLYFLGCVAFELLTGRSPLSMSRSANARMSAERFLRITPMSSAEVDAPQSIFRLVENLMAHNPEKRIQTPSQVLDRIRECKAELGLGGNGKAAPKKAQTTIFLVEKDEALQDVLRTKLKEKGFRVLIASDPVRAMDRFRQQPFDLLIVNAGTTGEDGFFTFECIVEEARRLEVPCAGILMLNEDQTDWQTKISEYDNVTTLVQPIKYKQLLAAIQASLGVA